MEWAVARGVSEPLRPSSLQETSVYLSKRPATHLWLLWCCRCPWALVIAYHQVTHLLVCPLFLLKTLYSGCITQTSRRHSLCTALALPLLPAKLTIRPPLPAGPTAPPAKPPASGFEFWNLDSLQHFDHLSRTYPQFLAPIQCYDFRLLVVHTHKFIRNYKCQV